MTSNITVELTQELLQIIKKVSKLKWEQSPVQGLKPSECELLGTLYLNLRHEEKAIPASELSNQLRITPAAVTHLLNPLEEDGFITRHKDPDDRRFVLVSLSSKGKHAAESVLKDTHQALQGLVSHIGEENTNTLMRLMTGLVEYFSEYPRN
jgi:DNA-binding MarR family transcriptional regulator